MARTTSVGSIGRSPFGRWFSTRSSSRSSASAGAAVDVHDLRVTELDEVVQRQLGAVGLVDRCAFRVHCGHAAADDHERGLGRRRSDVCGRHPRAHKDDPIDAVLGQRGERSPLAARPTTTGPDQELVAETRCELLNAADDLGEERLC